MQEAPLPEGFSLIEDTPPLPEGFTLIEDPVAEKRHTPRKDIEASPERIAARKNVRNLGDAVSLVLPGRIVSDLASNVPGYEYAKPVVDTVTDHLDTGLKAYANYAYGAARGLPVAGAYIDEAVGGLASLLGYDGDKAAETVRAMDDVSEEAHPVANMAGKVVGGVGGGYGLGARLFTKGAPAVVNLGRGLVAGTGLGAAHEFGDADGSMDERADAAKTGAAIGAAFAVGAPALGAVVTPAGRLVNKITPKKYKKAFADEQILKALDADGLTPKQAFAKYSRGQKNRRLHANSYAKSPAALVDISESMGDLGRTVTTNPGPARKIAGDFLETRQLSQNARINDTLERGLRQKSKDGYHKSKEALLEEQQTLSKPAYEKAWANAAPVRIDDLLNEWTHRAGETSMAIGKKMAAAVKDVARAQSVNDPVRALKILNGAKQGIDDAYIKARVKSPNLARELSRMKRELVDRIDATNPDYKAARAVYSSRAELLDAQLTGREFAKGDAEMSVEMFKKLSDPEQQMFRKGVMQELKKKMGAKQFTHDRTSLFSTPNAREVLGAVFQGDTKKFRPFKQFIDLMDTERTFVKTRNKIMGGSPTASRLAEASQYGIDMANHHMSQFRSGNWVEASLGWVAKKIGELYSFGAKDSEEIARIIFSDDPREISKTLLRLHRRYGEEKTRSMVQEIGEQWETLGLAGQFGAKVDGE